jgi:hypothetical protein
MERSIGTTGPAGCAPGGTDRQQRVGVRTRRDASISFGAVKAATDLRDLIGESGVEFNRARMARCPFHDDRHPSLSVRGDHWRCFGCGEHGDCFDWCERYYTMGTGEALRYLAARAGIAPKAPLGAPAPEPSPEVREARRLRDLRRGFLDWYAGQKAQSGERILRTDELIDRYVTRPMDLGTETAKYLYDRRARLEGLDQAIWDRQWEVLVEYYRDWVVYGRRY